MKIRAALALPLLAALLLAGCAPASDTAEPGENGPDTSVEEPSGIVTVFAAASLRTAFDEIAEVFEEQHPNIVVKPIVYDGSSTLVTQLLEGAQADVLATADESSMKDLIDSGLASDPQLFATNTLVVATPADNPGDVKSLADLANVVTVLCAPEVPCGKASVKLLEQAGVTVTPASLEQNVTAVVQKVAAGEADAGLVYATDVVGDDAVYSFVPDGSADVVNSYPIVALDGSNPAGVTFVEFVQSDAGQQILKDLGFGAP